MPLQGQYGLLHFCTCLERHCQERRAPGTVLSYSCHEVLAICGWQGHSCLQAFALLLQHFQCSAKPTWVRVEQLLGPPCSFSGFSISHSAILFLESSELPNPMLQCHAVAADLCHLLACNLALSQWVSSMCTRNAISHGMDVRALYGTSSRAAPGLCVTSTGWWWGSPLTPGSPSDRSLHKTGAAEVKAAACERNLQKEVLCENY